MRKRREQKGKEQKGKEQQGKGWYYKGKIEGSHRRRAMGHNL